MLDLNQEQPPIRFMHLHTEFASTPRMTVAYQVVGNKLTMGAAFCSAKDQYSRAIGRRIATGRMRKHPVVCTVPTGRHEDVLIAIENLDPEVIPGFPTKLLK